MTPLRAAAELQPERRGLAGADRMGATAVGRLNRRDFGVGFNAILETGSVVGDQVDLHLEIEAVLNK